jgi:hypothetical protein
MKKLILAAVAVTCAVSVFAQGTVTFNNRVVGSIVTHVYAPLAGSLTTHQIGNGSADFPVGTTSWAGYTLIGTTLAGQYGGQSTYAQLLSGLGNNVPEASLVPQATGLATFRTGAAAGFINGGVTASLSNVGADGQATLEMVAWDNSSGQYATWTQAQPAWRAGLIAAGVSGTWNSAVGGIFTSPNIIGAQSFNLYFVPEPLTFALAGLGAVALLIFRRRK